MNKRSILAMLVMNLLFFGKTFAGEASQELIKNIPESSKNKITQVCEYCGEPIAQCKCERKNEVKKQTFILSVTEDGFEPNQIDVKPGTHVVLNITRKTNATCAKDIIIPSLKLEKKLPLNKMVSIDTGKLEKGEVRFGCGMNLMQSGKIIIK